MQALTQRKDDRILDLRLLKYSRLRSTPGTKRNLRPREGEVVLLAALQSWGALPGLWTPGPVLPLPPHPACLTRPSAPLTGPSFSPCLWPPRLREPQPWARSRERRLPLPGSRKVLKVKVLPSALLFPNYDRQIENQLSKCQCTTNQHAKRVTVLCGV